MLRPLPRALALFGILALLPACGYRVIDPSTAEGVLNCDNIAIRDDDGAVDSCDKQACEACVDFCGLDCAVQQSYPPQYSCPSIGAYTVHDFCPEWGAEPDAEPDSAEESSDEAAPEAEGP